MPESGRGKGHVITIDGPAGSGKSTVSRILACRLEYLYLDTGAMYRAAAYAAHSRFGPQLPSEQELGRFCRALDLRFDAGTDPPRIFWGTLDISAAIRTPQMDMLSSDISAVPSVRAAMVALQRRIGASSPVVAEGRDMGTVVFPRAKNKFFLTASPEKRAHRRYLERLARSEPVPLETVLCEIQRRDHQDETRAIAPLKPAPDAIFIDTERMGVDEVVETILACLQDGPRIID